MMKRTSGMKNPINNLRRILPLAVVLLLLAMVFVAPVAANETKIGDTEYATLADALSAAVDGETIILLKDVTWTLPDAVNLQKQPMTSVDVTIDGEYKTLTVAGYGSANPLYVTSGKTLTIMNMSIVDTSVGDVEAAWEHGYLEFAGNTVFENVQFENGILMKGESATFTNCSFVGKTEEMTMYGAWVHNGTATFTDCTFTGIRGLKMHSADGNNVADVTIDKCTFAVTDKPGVVIGDVSGNSVTIKDSTFNGVAAGEQNMFIYESDTDLDTFSLTYNENNNIYHTVEWLNDEGAVIDTTLVLRGEVPTHSNPTKPADDTYTYTFSGWSPALSPVTGDETYTAEFTPVAKPVKSSSSSSGSSVWLTETPTPTPTQTPTETATPTDTVPTDIPVTQPTATPETPGFGILAALAGLGAVAVLRRK